MKSLFISLLISSLTVADELSCQQCIGSGNYYCADID
jgi:hypothetical protein